MRPTYFDEASPVADLHRRSIRGGAISIVAQVCTVVLQVVSTIVLARILMPEDFGLVAMVSAVTGFASVFVDLGTRDAVAQHGSVKEGEVSALHWMTVLVGALMCGVTILCAPLFVHFFGEPRLEWVAVALSATLLLPALYCQQYALMRRALMFRQLALIDVIANALGTLFAIGLAKMGFGYWALVCKPVIILLLITVGVWITCGWWPKRPTFTPGVRKLLGFGLNVTGFTVADYVAKSMDRVALGHTVGPRELGYYQNAFNVYDNAVAVTVPLHNVATTTLSKLRDDLTALRRAWFSALSALTYFAAPAFAILAVVGQDLVVLLLGEKWKSAGMLLGILALRGPCHVVERTLGWLHVSAGRPERMRRWGLFSCVATIVALFCGLPFGSTGVATAYVVLMALMFIPAIVYAGQPLGISTRDVLAAAGPSIITAFGVAAAGKFAHDELLMHATRLGRLLILCTSCTALYLVIMTFVFRRTRPLGILLSLIYTRKPARS